MSLAMVQYPPPTEQGWVEWQMHHAEHHNALVDALRRTKGVNLVIESPLYPVDFSDKAQAEIWSRAHLNIHNAMNAVLGIPGQDISIPDFKNKRETDTWLYYNFNQHQSAAQLCGEPV